MDHPSGVDRQTPARHLADDVAHAAPLFARILLVRAIWRHCAWLTSPEARRTPAADAYSRVFAGVTRLEGEALALPSPDGNASAR